MNEWRLFFQGNFIERNLNRDRLFFIFVAITIIFVIPVKSFTIGKILVKHLKGLSQMYFFA